MSLEEKNSEDNTNYHFRRFLIGIAAGGIGGLLLGKEANFTPFSDSIKLGLGAVPIMEKYFWNEEWKQVYEGAPSQTAGLYAGFVLVKLLTQ